MSLKTAFIGIDRFKDKTIRELAGCRRDALALWSLFNDTIPHLQSQLLINERATTAAIRDVLDSTLGAATSEDTVILFYSGHGTRDHRLVAHDTDRTKYAETTIDMGELARRFKESKAKIILCVLDCCFSGGAPARVLEDTPATRNTGLPLDQIAGDGRILIAASNVNEPALELNRHGLLTFAIMEALEAGTGTLSLQTIMDTVMQRVRAEADRMGYVQTPVFLGKIDGGIVFPSLKRGTNYFNAFPEAKGARVSKDINDLSVFGLDNTVIAAWREQYADGLNNLQLAAVNDYRVLDGNSVLVVAPTSSGKTFVGELATARALMDQRKAVFLFPYKALVNEKFDQFQRLYGERMGLRVCRCTGDYSDNVSTFVRGQYDLAVLTYEMFLSLSISNPATLNLFGLVVVDELQFISDPNRGIVVELLLTNLLAARQRGITPQLVGLSAVIGEMNSVDEWLSCQSLVRTERPVPLIEGVIDRSGLYQYVDTDGAEKKEQILQPHQIIQRRHNPEKQDVIVPLVRSLLSKSESERIIIFRNKRGSAQGAANYLAEALQLLPASDALAALPISDPSTSLPVLRHCIERGTAFHTSDLGRDERVVVEQAFRKRGGEMKVLVATTTVAAGINTPASTVILPEHEFLGEETRQFTVAEYKNMAGRAGRLGYNEKGRSILIADTGMEREQLFRRYVKARPEPIKSSFDPHHTETWLLRLLGQVKRIERANVVTLLASTYGGFLANKANPGWRPQAVVHLNGLLQQMTTLGLLEEEAGYVSLTLLGRACANSSLAFQSAMRLVKILKSNGAGLTAHQLMGLIQGLPELDDVYTPLIRGKGKKGEPRWIQDVLSEYGNQVASILQTQVESHFHFHARCKRASVVLWYTQGLPMEDIERNASANAFSAVGKGNVLGFVEATRFHLRSAANIVEALLIQNGPNGDDIENVLLQLEFGLPLDHLDLLNVGVPLTRGEYLTLGQHGVKTTESLWATAPSQLQSWLGMPRMRELEKARPRAPT